jgi:EAL domain-containing protein (putative c-di-GMP-specific phosphodiesterase class I)
VLGRACAQVQEWNEARPHHPLRLSVNLSSREFSDGGLRDVVDRVLVETGLDPHMLELELTEGGLMRNEAETGETLLHLHAKGIRLAIDDFGTGYSSLSRLKHFPIDVLKIDRSFVRNLTTDRGDAAIVAAIVTMAHGMRLRVTAEGVETAAQCEVLTEQTCDEMQGFLFGHPEPADAMLAHFSASDVQRVQ